MQLNIEKLSVLQTPSVSHTINIQIRESSQYYKLQEPDVTRLKEYKHKKETMRMHWENWAWSLARLIPHVIYVANLFLIKP